MILSKLVLLLVWKIDMKLNFEAFRLAVDMLQLVHASVHQNLVELWSLEKIDDALPSLLLSLRASLPLGVGILSELHVAVEVLSLLPDKQEELI